MSKTRGTLSPFFKDDIFRMMRRMEEQSVSFSSADLGIFQLLAHRNCDMKSAAERMVRYSTPGLVDYLLQLLPTLRCSSLSLLDLACGRGDHLIYLARSNPGLCCTGLDTSRDILDMAAQNVAQSGLENVALERGDMRTITLPKDFDVITLFNTFHCLGKKELIQLARKIYQALNRGGYLVIHDFYLEDTYQPAVKKIIFNTKLALEAKNGKLFRPSDFRELQRMGFREFQLFPIDDENIPVKDSAFFIYRK